MKAIGSLATVLVLGVAVATIDPALPKAIVDTSKPVVSVPAGWVEISSPIVLDGKWDGGGRVGGGEPATQWMPKESK